MPKTPTKKITGWTACVLKNGVPVLLTVKASRRRDAYRKLKQAFPLMTNEDQVRRTTMVPGRRHLGVEEFDFEVGELCIEEEASA
jgi:hypothetical protein